MDTAKRNFNPFYLDVTCRKKLTPAIFPPFQARLLTQLDTKESKASTEQPSQPQPQPEACYQAMVTDQLQQRLEGEIKRLQTMISDKQTLEDGLITDLNRKLQEATSRCRRLEHARNEAEKRLLYATLENERLNVSFGCCLRERKCGGRKVFVTLSHRHLVRFF